VLGLVGCRSGLNHATGSRREARCICAAKPRSRGNTSDDVVDRARRRGLDVVVRADDFGRADDAGAAAHVADLRVVFRQRQLALRRQAVPQLEICAGSGLTFLRCALVAALAGRILDGDLFFDEGGEFLVLPLIVPNRPPSKSNCRLVT